VDRVPQALFAERFLTTPSGPPPPEPDHYDPLRGYSVTADGRPFVESGSMLETRTITEAAGESSDADDDRLLSMVTKTTAPGEPSDRLAVDVDARSTIDPRLDTKTMTFADGEGADDDRDRVSARSVGTETRADGERPDRAQIDATAVGDKIDQVDAYHTVQFITVTKAAGERDD